MADAPREDSPGASPDVAEAQAAPEAPTGERLQDRYRVQRILGEGALGRTWLAVDEASGDRTVAIKELLPARLRTWKDFELFEREAEMLQSLQHPGIPAYLDHFELLDGEQPRLFLVQEFIEGGTLGEELRAGPLAEQEVRQLARDVLEILRYLHGLAPPVIHRDIKPDNLMRRSDGRVVLIDFGAVREVFDSSDAGGSTMVGTFGYMPPEQYAGQAWPQSDLFALGATCIHLLTGDPPESHFEKLFHIDVPADLPISVGLRRWLDRMIDPDMDRRFASAAEALQDLDEAFLMRALPRQAALLPPDPGPPPRSPAGFHLRDPRTGGSLLFGVVGGALLSLLSLPAAIVGFGVGNPGVGILASFVFVCVAAIPLARWVAVREQLRRFRTDEYVLGEVVRVWENGGLEYRYWVGGVYRYGHVRSHAERLDGLRGGDPIGLLYDPERPDDSRPFLG